MAAMPMGGWTGTGWQLVGTFPASYDTCHVGCTVYFHSATTSAPPPPRELPTRIHHAANGYRNGRQQARRPGPERSARLDRRVTDRWCWRRGCRRGR